MKASKKDFWSSVRADADQTIWLDGRVTASLDRSVPQIGAPRAWEAGYTGKGTTVAVLDTGLDPTHPDLVGAVADARDFTGSPSGTDDLVGHGTHVASTITGDGRYRGVAPDAELLVGKVFDDSGSGNESTIIAGMEWAAAAGADVVNMSLGSRSPSDGTDPMSQALNRITEHTGTLFVVAAGNTGPHRESIGSPAAADLALTVGAVDRQDALAEFSSRGPRLGDGAIKPDITAPGVDIIAARATRGRIGTPVGDEHAALSGTSMATPHVAGAAAVLAGQHPDWTPARLKTALMNSAEPTPSLSVYEQGAGRTDVARAVSQTVTADISSLSLGTALWPHHDDVPMEKTVTYRNSGTAPVTLNVAGSLTDPAGKPAVVGMVGVSPATVTEPAGDEASVKLTVRTAIESPDGMYQGALVASNGAWSVRTPIGFTKEIESYDVKLSFVGHTGAPTDRYVYKFFAHERPDEYALHDPFGTVVQRLPRGKYYFEATIHSTDFLRATEIAEPAFEVISDTTTTFDARVGERPGFTVDKQKAKPATISLGFAMTTTWGHFGHVGSGVDFENVLVRPARTSAPGAFEYTAQAVMGEPDGDGGFAGSPYVYHLRFTHPGTVPSGLNRGVPDSSLAVVHTTVASHGSGLTARKDGAAEGPMPLRVTEYYTPDVPWTASLDELEDPRSVPPDVKAWQRAVVPRTYQLGRPTTERWNQAVFGPAFPWRSRAYEWAGRKGDEVAFQVPMFADQSSRDTGSTSSRSARTTLSRNGSVVLEAPAAGYLRGTVPAGRAEYALRVEADNAFTELSTKVSADWTFTSGTVAGDPAALPLLAVRFAPSLDDHNKAAAGRAFTFPVYLQRSGSSTVTDVKLPTVQVSYDDGVTWKPVHVMRDGGKWTALLMHPEDAKYVSLKAQARDSAGNAVDQMIIRAYGLK